MELTERNLELWNEIFKSRAWGRYPPEELVRFAARTFPDSKGGAFRALEVGCGPGANIWYLAREGFKIAGVDGSAKAIATARERLYAEGLADAARDADLRVGNFAVLPWSDDTFDMVIDIEAIYANVTQVIRATISEIHRVLIPGGWFFGKMFGPETTGITSGRLLEPGTTEDPSEGPLHGKGIAHSFVADELREEFAMFSELRLDWVLRTDRNELNRVFEWLVQARK